MQKYKIYEKNQDNVALTKYGNSIVMDSNDVEIYKIPIL